MAIAKAFIAKAVYEITTTKGLIAYLRASPTLQRRAKKGVRAGRSDDRKHLSQKISKLYNMRLVEFFAGADARRKIAMPENR